MDAAKLAEDLIGAVREYVRRNLAPVVEDVKALKAVGPMVGLQGPAGLQGLPGPAGERGADGAPGPAGAVGQDGAPGEKGAVGEKGATGTDGQPGPAGEAGPVGDAGPQGAPGEQGAPGQQGERGEAGATGERGPSGERGPAGERGIQGEAGPTGPQGETGPSAKDGERGPAGEPGPIGPKGDAGPQGEKGPPGSAGLKGDQGVVGRDGLPGDPGRDAPHVDVLDAVDSTRRYQRGTWASHRGGVIRSFRATDPLGDGQPLEKAGWQVVLRGIDAMDILLGDDLRSVTLNLCFTDGQAVQKTLTVPAIIDRGVWQERGYEPGDGVTWGGSFHIAQRSTQPTEKPSDDSGAFRLAVKKGRDGRDGLKGEKGERGAEGRSGQDLGYQSPRGPI